MNKQKNGFEKLHHIIKVACEDKGACDLTDGQLAKQVGVSARQVQTYITRLKSEYGLEVEGSGKRGQRKLKLPLAANIAMTDLVKQFCLLVSELQAETGLFFAGNAFVAGRLDVPEDRVGRVKKKARSEGYVVGHSAVRPGRDGGPERQVDGLIVTRKFFQSFGLPVPEHVERLASMEALVMRLTKEELQRQQAERQLAHALAEIERLKAADVGRGASETEADALCARIAEDEEQAKRQSLRHADAVEKLKKEHRARLTEVESERDGLQAKLALKDAEVESKVAELQALLPLDLQERQRFEEVRERFNQLMVEFEYQRFKLNAVKTVLVEEIEGKADEIDTHLCNVLGGHLKRRWIYDDERKL